MNAAKRKAWVKQYWGSVIFKSEPPEDAPDAVLENWDSLCDDLARQLGIGVRFECALGSAEVGKPRS